MKKQLKNRHRDLKFAAGLTSADYNCTTLPSDRNVGKVFKFRRPSFDQSIFNYLDLEPEFRKLLDFLNKNCESCGSALTNIVEQPDNTEIYSGKLISNFSTQTEFISEANNYGVNRIFLENVGFLEIAEKKTFHILTDKEASEICFYVFEELNARNAVNSFFEVPENDPLKYFLVDHKTVVECSSFKYCLNCASATSVPVNINFRMDYVNTLAVDRKMLFFIEVIRLFNPRFKFNEDHLSQFSLVQIHILATLRKLYFSNTYEEENSNFPICNEFNKSFFLRIKEIAANFSLATNKVFDTYSLKNSSGNNSIQNYTKNVLFEFSDSFSTVVKAKKNQEFKKIILLHESSSIDEKSRILEDFTSENPKARYLEYQGIDDYETNYGSSSSLLSFLGLGKEIADLFIKHPLSKERGLKLKDFSYSKSSFNCSGCSGHGISEDNFVCKICFGRRFNKNLSDITWRGLWIGELMNTNFYNFKMILGNLFPKSKQLVDSISDAGLGELKLGDNLRLLSPIDRQKVSFFKFCQQNFKDNDIVLFDGIHPLLNSSEVFGEKVFTIFAELAKKNLKLIVVSRTSTKF